MKTLALCALLLHSGIAFASDSPHSLARCWEWTITLNSQNATSRNDLLTALPAIGNLGPAAQYLSVGDVKDESKITYGVSFDEAFMSSSSGPALKEMAIKTLLPLSGTQVFCVRPQTNPRASLSN